jgi:hypothetical protein
LLIGFARSINFPFEIHFQVPKCLLALDIHENNLSEFSNLRKAAKANSISFQSRAMSPEAGFTLKLHLIYLINDLLHYWLVSKFDPLDCEREM